MQRQLDKLPHIENIKILQIHTFGAPDRDPRGRIISTAYGAVLNDEEIFSLHPGSDASQAAWCNLKSLPPMAFDHMLIIKTALGYFDLEYTLK